MHRIASFAPPISARVSSFTSRSAADRFAVYVLSMIDCEHDLKTITNWAKHTHVSSSTVRELCRIVQIKAHDARDFGRVLRAICKSGRVWMPETVLDCADIRTLNKMMKSAGFAGGRGRPTPTIREFMENQCWIPKDHPVMGTLNDLLQSVYSKGRIQRT